MRYFLLSAIASLALTSPAFAGAIGGDTCEEVWDSAYDTEEDIRNACDLLQQSENAASSASVKSIELALPKAFNRVSGDAATRDNLVVSTQGAASGVYAWTSLNLRGMDGDLKAGHRELTFGADVAIGARSYAGVLLSTGQTVLDHNATSAKAKVTAVTAGIYGATALSSNTELAAFYLAANPRYKFGNIEYTAERRSFGITLANVQSLNKFDLVSSLALSEIREEHPSKNVFPKASYKKQSLTGSLRANFMPEDEMRPFVELGLSANRLYEKGNDQNFNAARWGAGFDIDLSNGGLLSMSLDGGKVEENITDGGLELNYLMKF